MFQLQLSTAVNLNDGCDDECPASKSDMSRRDAVNIDDICDDECMWGSVKRRRSAITIVGLLLLSLAWLKEV